MFWRSEKRHNEVPLLPLVCRVSSSWVRKPGIAFMTEQSDLRDHTKLLPPCNTTSFLSRELYLLLCRFILWHICSPSFIGVAVAAFHGLKEREHNTHWGKCHGPSTHRFSARFCTRSEKRAVICIENTWWGSSIVATRFNTVYSGTERIRAQYTHLQGER